MKKRVLIGSCGGLTGSYLTRQFRQLGCYVIGADAGERNVTRFFADEFVKLPVAKNENFLSELLRVLKEQQVDYYIPTHSQEIRAVSQNEAFLRQNWGGKFIVSPYETFLLLDDKKCGNVNLKTAGIPVPRMYESLTDVDHFPVFMKPNVGSGSKDSRKVETLQLAEAFEALYPNSTFYQCVSGTEYTVDCMFDDQGKLLGYNQRVREKSMGGAVIVTRNDYAFDSLPYLKKLEAAFVFKGCVNFQYILCEGVPYFIDINLRYASGGLPLTVESGICVPQIMMDIFEGRPVAAVESCSAPGKTMYRYFEEIFEG
jgi:carbamoyl-phosphate synthase large subunit